MRLPFHCSRRVRVWVSSRLFCLSPKTPPTLRGVAYNSV